MSKGKHKVQEVKKVSFIGDKVVLKPELNTPGKAQPKKNKVEFKETVDDRSAFNCTTCAGDGLIAQGTKDVICPQCLGTGKVA